MLTNFPHPIKAILIGSVLVSSLVCKNIIDYACNALIKKLLSSYKSKIHSIFHFGEFARIYQSFEKFDECYDSNSIGTKAVFKFCLDNKIKLVYSATSAGLGNLGKDKK